jgi:hypothetical protein
MRILVWDKSRKLFLSSRDQWVEAVDKAKDFKDCAEAVACVLLHELPAAHLYFAFPNKKYNFHVPLAAFSSMGPEQQPKERRVR